MNIGNQIKALRAEKKVTQEELAEYLGISAQAVSKWETDASTPDITLLPTIATYFGVTIDELFALREEEQFERIENMYWREQRIPHETFEQSVRFLNEQVAKGKHLVRAYKNLAYLYNQRASVDHADASEYAKKVLELEPENKYGWVAFLEANKGVCGDEWYDNHFSVIQYIKEFLEKNPKNYQGLYAIIENMLADGWYEEALPYIKEIGEVKPGSQMLMYSGDVALSKGNVEEAKRLWNQAVSEYPNEWQAYCRRADRLKKLGCVQEAIADYEKCLEVQKAPHVLDALYSLAQMHEQLGKYEAAIRDHERILEYLAADYHTIDGEMVESLNRKISSLKNLIK